jgi:glycosyltransferase involved in cell wall biosynthesis
MNIGIDAKCLVGKRTGVANYVYYLIPEIKAIRPNDTIYLYSHTDFDNPLTSNRVVKRIVNTIQSKSGVIWLYTECKHAIVKDGINVFWSPSGLLPKLDPKIKTVLTIHDFVWKKHPESMTFLYRLAVSLLSSQAVRNADRIFTNSDAVAAELKEYLMRQADAVIRPAVDNKFYHREFSEIEAVKRKYCITAPYFFVVGTLEPRKNLEIFLRAYSDLLAIHSKEASSCRLVIAGGKGWKYSKMVKLINYAQQNGWVQCLGYVEDEDLAALYSGAEVFFMPSFYEGFGMPVLEARYCGTPLAVADVPAMHEAGGNAALYHPPTYEGIYEVLERIIVRKEKPPRPNIESVLWSWKSGALQLSQMIDQLVLPESVGIKLL